MKKTLLAVACAAAWAGTAHAYSLGWHADGVLVPHAVHNGATDTTVVGLIANEAGTVYWTFFDVDSNHVTDGQFTMTANDMYGFNWSKEAGTGLEGTDGYLVFVMDNDKDGMITSSDLDALAANAFQVMTTAQDVAFIPTMPLDDYDFNTSDDSRWYLDNPTTMGPNSLADLSTYGDVYEGTRLNMRYFIDGATGGTDTAIVVWTAQDSSGTYTVNMYDADQNRKSVNFVLENAELNVFDPESISGRPANFTDGFIAWTVPDFGGTAHGGNVNLIDSVFSYSVVAAPAFGAQQTLLSTHDLSRM